MNLVTRDNSPQGLVILHIALLQATATHVLFISYRSRVRDSLVSSALVLGLSEEGVGRGPTTHSESGLLRGC